MPQLRPTYLTGHYYHFYNRGRSKLSIFLEPENHIFVLRKLLHYLPALELSMIAYCLMPNHYHFLVRQDGEQRAGLLPQRVFNSYTKAYNKRYDHSGTLFEGNYRVKPVENDSHLLHLCRYIHGNPVKDGLVDQLADWPYSNYLEWIRQRDGKRYDPEFVRHHFNSPAEYRNFVIDGLRGRDLPEDIQPYLEES